MTTTTYILILLEAGIVLCAVMAGRIDISRRFYMPRHVSMVDTPLVLAPPPVVEVLAPVAKEEMEDIETIPAGAVIDVPSMQVYSDWVMLAQAVALDVASRNGQATADDIWNLCPVPDGIDPRVVSAAFPRSDWVVVGYTKSARKENHGRRIAIHRRKLAEAA